MSGYLLIAENITYKNNKLSCINIFDNITTIVMPSEFVFDLVLMCGPNWTPGEHKLMLKAKGNNGKEVTIGDVTINIPQENFVYNAFAHDLKIVMDESVSDLTIYATENDETVISRTYPVRSMFTRQPAKKSNEEQVENNENKEENQEHQN